MEDEANAEIAEEESNLDSKFPFDVGRQKKYIESLARMKNAAKLAAEIWAAESSL